MPSAHSLFAHNHDRTMNRSHGRPSALPLVAVFFIAIVGVLLPQQGLGAFGVTDDGKAFVVDSGAGLVFKVNKTNGDIVSIRYQGGAELQEAKKGSHIASGLGSATKVTPAVIGDAIVKITLATDAGNNSVKSLTQYLLVRKGMNNIYMATYATAEPNVGELRWITRLDGTRFPESPKPSNNRGTTRTIESKDVFGSADGTTHSKYYGDAQTHGKDRAIDMTYCGVSGPGTGVWMIFGTRESSSGGPFHRDIENQSTEVYNYMNSGHNMTEPPRLNVLHGPYALVFTDGQPPAQPLDFAWIDTAGIDLKGYVPASQRGTVVGTVTGVPAGMRGIVGFSNASAQYWATVETGDAYISPPMKPGGYDVKLIPERAGRRLQPGDCAGRRKGPNSISAPRPSLRRYFGSGSGTAHPSNFSMATRSAQCTPPTHAWVRGGRSRSRWALMRPQKFPRAATA